MNYFFILNIILIIYYHLIKIIYKLTRFLPFLKNNKIKPFEQSSNQLNDQPTETAIVIMSESKSESESEPLPLPIPEFTCDICLNIHNVYDRINIDCDSIVPHYVCEMCYLKIINTNALCPFCRNEIMYDKRDVIRMLLKSKYDGLEFKNDMLKEHFDTYEISLDDKHDYSCIITCITLIIIIGYFIYLLSPRLIL